MGMGEHAASEPDTPEATELRQLRQQVRKLEESVTYSERTAREARSAAELAQRAVRTHREVVPAVQQGPGVTPSGDSHAEAHAQGSNAPPPEPQAAEVIEQMDERFFSEPLDPGWSQQARRRVEQLGGMMPKGARVVSLDCRTSLCRMEMSHPNLESFQDFVRQGLLGGGYEWDGPVMAAVKGDPHQPGELLTVAYLAREGTDLSPSPRE